MGWREYLSLFVLRSLIANRYVTDYNHMSLTDHTKLDAIVVEYIIILQLFFHERGSVYHGYPQNAWRGNWCEQTYPHDVIV